MSAEPPEHSQPQSDSLASALLGGAAASAISRALTYPPDLLKAQLQIHGVAGERTLQNPTTLQIAKQVAHAEGPAGFYRGFGAVLAGVVPATMVYYAAYETSKKLLPEEWGALKGPAVGLMTQLAAGLAFTPVDIIKERMQAQRLMRHAYSYTGPFNAASSILRSQGPGGLLRGYWLTNAVWLPWNTLYIALYEQSKHSMAAFLQSPTHTQGNGHAHGAADNLPGWAIVTCSAASAAAAAVATHPLDVVKTRLQVGAAAPAAAAPAAAQSSASMQIARDLLMQEGWRGFGRGLTARVLTIAPGAALQWYLYEGIKAKLNA